MDRPIRSLIVMGTLFVTAFGSERFLDVQLDAAYKAYETQEWEKARATYDLFPTKNSALWYNMGNCAYKMGDNAAAFVYWKRALRGAPFAEQAAIFHNLTVLYKKIGRNQNELCYGWHERWAYTLPLFHIQLIVLLLWYALSGVWFVKRRMRPLLSYLISFLLVSILVIFVNIGILKVSLEAYERAVVTQSAPLFSGPHEQYHQRGNVGLCDELLIHDKRDGWYKVTDQAQNGWISSTAVELI